MATQRHNHKHYGNALSEYGFLAVIVLAGILVGMLYLGGGLNNVLKGLKQDLQSHGSSAGKFSLASTSHGETEGGAQPITAGADPICLQNGRCFSVDNVLINPTPLTAGSNGGEWSMSLTAAMLKLSKQIEDNGGDMQLAMLIREMANRGHDMAFTEQEILQPCNVKTCRNNEDRTGRSRTMRAQYQEYLAASAAVEDYLARNPDSLPPTLKQVIIQNNATITDIAQGFHADTDWGGDTVMSRVKESDPRSTSRHSNLNCGTQETHKDCYR